MTLEIRFLEDGEGNVTYGKETIYTKETGKQERIHVHAELWDDETLIAKRLVQGIDPDDEADRDAKVQAAFKGFKAGDEPEPQKVPLDVTAKTAGWKSKIVNPALDT